MVEEKQEGGTYFAPPPGKIGLKFNISYLLADLKCYMYLTQCLKFLVQKETQAVFGNNFSSTVI